MAAIGNRPPDCQRYECRFRIKWKKEENTDQE
jgi:hypothetical protein